jgi:predicted Zn-dependent protease
MGLALGGQQMAQNQFLAFTRAQEQAADQAALTYMERLGWSPRGLAALLERMVLQENIASSRQDPYFRSHPLTRDRLEFVRDGLGRSPIAAASLPAALETRFVMARAKLDGFLDNPQTTFRRLPESDSSAPARYARAIAHFRSGRIPDSVALLDQLIREQPLNPYLHELKGQVLLEGQRPRDAVAPYREAVRLAPQEPLIRLNHARLLIELGDPASLRLAVRELETSLAGERDSAFAWRQLAMAQGRLGNNALADLALAEEAVLNGEFADARRFAARAEAALPAGPQRLRAQDLRFAARRDNMTPDDRALEDRMRRGGR